MFAWILNTKPVKYRSSGSTRPWSLCAAPGAGAMRGRPQEGLDAEVVSALSRRTPATARPRGLEVEASRRPVEQLDLVLELLRSRAALVEPRVVELTTLRIDALLAVVPARRRREHARATSRS
jgi:hypothetical protein